MAEENLKWKRVPDDDYVHIWYEKSLEDGRKNIMVEVYDELAAGFSNSKRKIVTYISFSFLSYKGERVTQLFKFLNDECIKVCLEDDHFDFSMIIKEYEPFFKALGEQDQRLKKSLEGCVRSMALVGLKYKERGIETKNV